MTTEHTLEPPSTEDVEYAAIKQAIARVEAEARASIATDDRVEAERRLRKEAEQRECHERAAQHRAPAWALLANGVAVSGRKNE